MTRFFTLFTLILLSLPVSSMAGVALTPVGTYATGVFDDGASEIVAYDPAAATVFVINANTSVVDLVDISDPANPALKSPVSHLDVAADLGFAVGGINSVDVKNGIVAVATENADPTMNGYLVFYDTTGTYLGFVNVGVLPDAVKFSPDGTKLVVANEGEPVGAVNPPGSISVVDISGGVASAVSDTLGFAAFDGREAEFLNKGLKLENGVPMSLDLEPEFSAISPDGTQAFVTLQEANAFAGVDLQTPKIVDILPLGVKDHSKGQPELDLFSFKNLPLIGIDANKLKIKHGGFSGLHYDGTGKKGALRFLTVSDRGPNGEDVVDGSRTFNLPKYQARVTAFEVGGKNNNGNPGGGHHGHHGHGRTFNNGKHGNSGKAEITNTIYLTRANGKTPITGLPNIPGFDEIPVDAKGNPVKYDRFGADLEGIVRDPLDNSLWMVDEYRPSIYHFTDRGRMIVRLVPENTHTLGDSALKQAQFGPHANDPGFYGMETLPEVYSKHRSNRGFEGVALDPDKRLLYAFIQSPMENPDTSTRSSHVVRILAVDVDESSPGYLNPVAEYVYLLERPVHTPDDVDKIGDAVYIGDNKFLVLERDSALEPTSKKFIFEIDLKGATNIRNNPIADEMTSGTLEQETADSLAVLGIKAVFKRKVLNLPSIGYLPSDKSEGITMLPDGRLAVINDNDFGIEAAQGLEPVLGIITFSEGNMLDASDKDSTINIANWPVLGMYQPDGIDKYTYNGETYYVTANEGDTRDPEEVRVKNLNLDPVIFPDAAVLKQDANLRRLKATNILGDLDGDGAYDRIFNFGGRSFTIWDSFGNLVFDSSDDFENITADTFPAQFNSDNTDNTSFDERSDDKGPEPEGVAVGKVGPNTYAFIGLERMGGAMVYDVTNPNSPEFVDYVNNRNFSVDADDPAAGDLGPEGLFFVPSTDSPNGKALLIVGNEISGTTTVYQIDN